MRHPLIGILGIGLLCGSMSLCAAESKPAHDAPVAAAGIAHFDVFADGDAIHLLAGYRDPNAPGIALWYRRSADGGLNWTAPVRVNREGDDVFAPHPGENPQIAARGDRIVAVWNDRAASAGKPGPLVSVVSDDGGRTWRRGENPASDGANDYHALVELGAGAKAFHTVWLHGATRGSDAPQGLHYASSLDGTTWTKLTTIATPTCECCWNRILATDDSVGVLYRGGAPRDMMFTSARNGKWSRPVTVGRFDWTFEGCPHTGGALAADADGKTLHALVWTGKETKAGMYHVASTNAGKRWGEPTRIGGDDAVDADLAIAADGTIVAAWDTKTEIFGSQSRDGGIEWSTPRALSPAGTVARHPRIVWTHSGFTTIWLHGTHGASALRSNYGEIAAPPG